MAAGGPRDVTGNVNRTPSNIKLSRVAGQATAGNHMEQICSLHDPFCPRAVGAKIPDGQSNTLTTTSRGFINFTTGATGGLAAIVIAPLGPQGYSTLSPTSFPVTSSTTPQFSNMASSPASLFDSYADKVRTVSAGFILRATQSANNAQGFFTIQTQQDFTFGTSAVGGDYLGVDNTTISNYPGMECSYVFRPTNKVLARQLVAATATATPTASVYGWPAAVVYYQGGATGANVVGIIEYFINTEWTVSSESSIAPLMPPPTVAKPAIIKALDKVQSDGKTVIKGGVEVVGDYVKKQASSAITSVAADLWDEMEGAFAFLGM